MKGVWANENALGEGWYPVVGKVVPFLAVNDIPTRLLSVMMA